MIFPKEIIEFSEPHLSYRHTVRSQLIYSSTILFIAGLVGSLPFISTEVSVKSRGIIRASLERHALTSPVQGKIQQVYMRENQHVKKGEALLILDTNELENKLSFIQQRKRLLRSYISDIDLLLRSLNENKSFVYQNAVYKSEWLTFEQEVSDIELRIQNLSAVHERKRVLYGREVISRSEFEQSEFQLQSERKKRELLTKTRRNEWQQQKITYQNELDQHGADEVQLEEEKKDYQINAPITGVLLNVKGLSVRSTIYANEKIAEISPVSSKVAELYVSTRDIGLLKNNMEVRFKVDAFDHNQWGYLTGNISEISNDVVIIEGKPVFKVQCSLNSDYLVLSNGYKGYLKKGMTLEGRFVITQRTLFQLLYDNVDDWLNPV